VWEGVVSAVNWTCDPHTYYILVRGEAVRWARAIMVRVVIKRGTNYVVLYGPCVRWWAWARSAGTVLPLRPRLFTWVCGGLPIAAGVIVSGRVFTRGTPVVADEPTSGRVSSDGTSELASVLVSANFGGVRKSAEHR
jgi:hypothetical protein